MYRRWPIGRIHLFISMSAWAFCQWIGRGLEIVNLGLIWNRCSFEERWVSLPLYPSYALQIAPYRVTQLIRHHILNITRSGATYSSLFYKQLLKHAHQKIATTSCGSQITHQIQLRKKQLHQSRSCSQKIQL